MVKRLIILLALTGALSGKASAYDAEWRDNGASGCAGEIKNTHFTVTINWTNLPPARVGSPTSIRSATNPTTNLFVWTPGAASGSVTLSSTFDVHGINTDAYGVVQHMDYVGTHTGEDATLTVSGGRDITRFDSQNTSGCPITGTSVNDTLTYNVSGVVATATFDGSIKANCATQHALGLTINGVQVSYQVTSIFATKTAPSTVTIHYTCNSGTIDCAEGKPWILSVDGAATQSGTIHYAPNFAVTLNVNGKGSASDPVFFDCAPKSGTLALNGTLTIPPSGSGHSLSVKVKGATVASSSSSGGASMQTTITLTKLVEDVQNGDSIEWYVDGVLAKQSTVALSCAYNAELDQTTCTAVDTFTGVATQNASPTPPPTPPPTPSPTTPPQDPHYTPPPPPTYTPPPPQSTPTGGGDVRVMNPESIYQPIVDALKVDNAGTASRNNSASGTGADFSARGHLDDLQPQVDRAVGKVDAIKDKGVSAITGLKDSFSTLPTSLGTVSTVNFGTGLFNGIGPTAARFTTLPTSVDLTPYMTGINLARTVMLWALTIFFGFLTVRAFTWTQ